MLTPLRSHHIEFARGFDQGEAQGLVRGVAVGATKALLAVLYARGVDVPEQVHARIAYCTDLDQIDRWIHHAATASKIEELYDFPPMLRNHASPARNDDFDRTYGLKSDN